MFVREERSKSPAQHEADFFDEIGALGLGSRLKRLSDRLISDATSIHTQLTEGFEPRWFPLFALLADGRSVGIVEAAERLGVSQPAISKFAKELKSRGLVSLRVDKRDSRKRVLGLSKAGKEMLRELQPLWQAVRTAALELCEESGLDFYQGIRSFERALANKSLLHRTLTLLQDGQADAPKVEMVPYRPKLQPLFQQINSEWIRAMFSLEPSDEEMLSDPQRHVLQHGGAIWFAKVPILGVVGCYALVKTGSVDFELTKMAVKKEAQGLRVGAKLLQHAIQQARELGSKNLYLLSNKKCQAALHLYRKHGFREDPEVMKKHGAKYTRCDIAMRFQPA